jgi:perosamine synthetase
MEKKSGIDEAVFPAVGPTVKGSYRGDAETPVRSSRNPLPTIFPRKMDPKAIEYVDEVLKSGLTSDVTARFEKAFAAACGVSHAVTVTNCTAAVHTAVAVCDLSPGDEVVVSGLSDYGSVQGVLVENAVPVFADVDLKTGNTTAEEIAKVITPRTRAIVLVYFYGMMTDVDAVAKLAKERGLILIEDCCQTPLAEYKGKKAGSFGTMGCFSFDSEKHLSTDGGGAIITNDARLAERLRKFAVLRGAEAKPGFGRTHTELAYNYRFSSVQAAIGLAQLAPLPEQNEKRREAARKLTQRLEGIDGLLACKPPAGIDHVYWLYNIQLEMEKFDGSIDEIADAMVTEGMKECGVARYYLLPEAVTFLHPSKITFSGPCEEMTAAKRATSRYAYSADTCPMAKRHLDRSIRWTWTPDYTDQDIQDMAKIISKVTRYYRKKA